MVCRLFVVAIVLGACGGGGGNNSTPHNVTVDVQGPGTVTSTPTGIDCPSACSGTFTDHVTLYAQPDSGATFVGWSGACSGTDPSCALGLSSDESATAMFAPAGNQPLTVSVTGPGSVTGMNLACPGSNCMQSYAPGTMVTLTASPDASASFTGWSGDCTGTAGCTVTMDQARNVSATFTGAAGMHMLSVTVTGPGTVTSTPSGINCSSGTCTAMFNSTDTVSLVETPNGAATFSMWSGACTGNGTCSIPMTSDRSVTATFASSGYVLTVHLHGDGTGVAVSSPAGINCSNSNPAGCSYDFGPSVNSVTVTATPDSTASFAGIGMGTPGGCMGNNYASSCPYPLGSGGTNVDVWFSAWQGHFQFPASLTGLSLIGGQYVAVGVGGNAITSTNDNAGGHGTFWTGRQAPAALNALVAQGSSWFAARDGGKVSLSPDGLTWIDYAAGTADLEGIASSGTLLVAVGKSGSIQYSTSGVMWNAATSNTANQLNAITYGGGQFVAVGFAGTILTSPDGTTWSTRTSGTAGVLYSVAYSGTKYVAVGVNGLVVTSPDGVTWTKPTTTGLPVTTLRGIAWNGSVFVAAGDTLAVAYTSTDAVTWASPGTQISDALIHVDVPGDGYTYLLGASGSLMRSNDNGVTWALILAPGGRGAPGQGQSNGLMSLAYNGTIWVAGGQWGSIFTSSDAVTWTSRRAAPCCDFITGIAWGAGLTTPVFAAVGTLGNQSYVITSPDGITWTKVFPTAGTFSGYAAGIAYGGPTKGFSVLGWFYNGTSYQGMSASSLDGATWSASASASTDVSSQIYNLTYGNGVFLGTGMTHDTANLYGDPAIYTSTDGASWAQVPVTGSFPLGAAAYGNGVYATLEPEGNAVWTSPDATTWTRTALTFAPGQYMTFGNGVFYDSALYTSANGTTWTQVSPLPNLAEINGGVFTAVVYGANQWVGVSGNELFVTHP